MGPIFPRRASIVNMAHMYWSKLKQAATRNIARSLLTGQGGVDSENSFDRQTVRNHSEVLYRALQDRPTYSQRRSEPNNAEKGCGLHVPCVTGVGGRNYRDLANWMDFDGWQSPVFAWRCNPVDQVPCVRTWASHPTHTAFVLNEIAQISGKLVGAYTCHWKPVELNAGCLQWPSWLLNNNSYNDTVRWKHTSGLIERSQNEL